MKAADPSQGPLAVPVSELQHWVGSAWPGPGPRSQHREPTTGEDQRGCNHQFSHAYTQRQKRTRALIKVFYQSSMSVAGAASSVAALRLRRLRLRLLRWPVVMRVSEDQTLSGRGRRCFSSSTHRLLQQRGKVQATAKDRKSVV